MQSNSKKANRGKVNKNDNPQFIKIVNYLRKMFIHSIRFAWMSQIQIFGQNLIERELMLEKIKNIFKKN